MFKSLSFYALLVATLLFSFGASAQFSDLVTDNPSVTFSMAGQNTTQTTALTGVLPIKDANGWAGIYASRQIVEGTVVDEVYVGHVQGGFRISGFGIEGFTELQRNMMQGDRLRIGYFGRPGIYEVAGGRISGGFGNFSENAEVLDELDKKEDAETSFGWLAFVSGHWSLYGLNLGATVRYLPELDFDTQALESVLNIGYEFYRDFTVGIILESEIDRETKVSNQYQIALTWTPED